MPNNTGFNQMEGPVQIILENGTCTNAYNAGQTVHGKVKCVFPLDEVVRVVRVKYEGYAKTQWPAHIGKKRKTFSAVENYFSEEHTLHEGSIENRFRILAGTHVYPFSYTLPQALPTSYSDDFGTIQYKITATVDRPWNSNYEAEQLLFVISPLDLNLLPVREPFSQSIEENLSHLCRNAGEITFSVYLPVVGYAADQKINVGTYVQNMSNVNVESVKYKIIRSNEYIATDPFTLKRTFEYKLTSYKAGRIGAHAEKSWTSSLEIPLERTINLQYCNIMNASHRLEVKVKLPFPYSNLKITCPITLGTVPLAGVDTSMLGPPIHSANTNCLFGSTTTLDSNNSGIISISREIGTSLEDMPHSNEKSAD